MLLYMHIFTILWQKWITHIPLNKKTIVLIRQAHVVELIQLYILNRLEVTTVVEMCLTS